MEIKDLILLLMIPVLLIGILTFVNHNTLTGNVVASPDDNPKLGTYSILPSFRAKIDYNLQDYSDLKTKLKAAIDKCAAGKQQDIKGCIRDETSKNTYNWNCDERDSDILYDFTDKLKECINLENENAVCRFSFDSRDYLNNEKAKRNFQIKLTNWYYPRIKAELIENDKIIATEFIDMGKLSYSYYENKDKKSRDADSILIKVNYENGNPLVDDASASVGDGTVKLSKIFLIDKSNKEAKFVDYNYESLFKSPEPANTIIDLPLMQGLAFCAKTGKKIMAYDALDGEVKEREIVYKFAVTLPNPVPAPVSDFLAKDNLKAENSALLVWKKDSQAGIKSYSVYYSTKDFVDMKMSDIHKDNSIKKVSVLINNPIEIERVNLDSCEFNPINEPCKYKNYDNPLLKNKLYYIKSENKFVYVLSGTDFKDGTDYNLAITAVNDKNEEIDNDKTISENKNIFEIEKNYLPFSSNDDLAPEKVSGLKAQIVDSKLKLFWSKPLKNIDGSSATDVGRFNIYYKKSSDPISPLLDISPQVSRIAVPDAKCDSIVVACEFGVYSLPNIEKGNLYNFAVTALDENSNEYTLDVQPVHVLVS